MKCLVDATALGEELKNSVILNPMNFLEESSLGRRPGMEGFRYAVLAEGNSCPSQVITLLL